MMGDSGDFSKQLNDSPAVAVTGKIMVAAVIILFLVIVFVICVHLYAKYYWWRAGDPSENPSRRRRRFVSTSGQNLADVQAVRQGLDPSVLKSLPVTAFNPKDHKEGLECAVCLSELSEGEKARILPNCNHGFHVGCIDTWFQSHSTCPLCRNSIAAGDSDGVQLPSNENNTGAADNSAASNNAAGPWRFPTNVLFWGNQTQVISGVSNAEGGPSSSSSSRRPYGMLVIDIPRSSTPETVATPSSTEAKSPIPTRLMSLTRLLSRGRVPPSPCSPSSVDIEQGAGRS